MGKGTNHVSTGLERFADKVVIITGAASGIGKATVERLAAEGAIVVAADVAPLAGLGLPAMLVQADVSDPVAVQSLIDATVAEHGRIDVLCNVAGILRFHNYADITLEVWNQIIGVNLTGTFLMCQAAMPHLLESGGNIVNMSSTAALAGHPWAVAYAASKGGILALSQSLAIEFGRQGVRTNIIAPGSIDTPITNEFFFPEGADKSLLYRTMALDKARGPEYIASVIAFVASDDGAHMNGSVLRADGGTLS
jgi:meso-butanediol dehydrogenase/(S,S)-butanediol dehydrogenase/diacetyl reductase